MPRKAREPEAWPPAAKAQVISAALGNPVLAGAGVLGAVAIWARAVGREFHPFQRAKELASALGDRIEFKAPVFEAPTFENRPTFAAPSFAAPTFQAPTFQAPSYAAPTFQAPTYAPPTWNAPPAGSQGPSLPPVGQLPQMGGDSIQLQPKPTPSLPPAPVGSLPPVVDPGNTIEAPRGVEVRFAPPTTRTLRRTGDIYVNGDDLRAAARRLGLDPDGVSQADLYTINVEHNRSLPVEEVPIVVQAAGGAALVAVATVATGAGFAYGAAEAVLNAPAVALQAAGGAVTIGLGVAGAPEQGESVGSWLRRAGKRLEVDLPKPSEETLLGTFFYAGGRIPASIIRVVA